jgi:hypothetical protein
MYFTSLSVWTADRLARHGMDHPDKCPLCDQEEETIDHLLVSCKCSRLNLKTLHSCIGGKRQAGLSQDQLGKGSIHSSSSEPGFFGSIGTGVCLMLLPRI